MIRQAGNAQEGFRPAVNHFAGQRNVIFCEGRTAADTADRLSHGKAPSGKDTASYHDRQLSG